MSKKSTIKETMLASYYRNRSSNGSLFCQMGQVVVMLYFPYENWQCRKIGLISRLNSMQMATAIGGTVKIRFDIR